jgi:hypothetical protein
MKRLATGLVAGLALVAGSLTSQSAPAPADGRRGPRIVVEPASFDFGEALQYKTLNKEFVVRNLGDEPLRLEDVKTSCGCTAALPNDRVVPPGGQTRLRVSLDTRSGEGRVERTIVIRSNDPRHELSEVKLVVTVVAGTEPTSRPAPQAH